MLRFIAYVAGLAWKYGAKVPAAIAAWARANWQTVLKWINNGISFATIVQWIGSILGFW